MLEIIQNEVFSFPQRKFENLLQRFSIAIENEASKNQVVSSFKRTPTLVE